MLAIDLVGGLAKDNVLTKLVDPGLQLHTTYLPKPFKEAGGSTEAAL